MADNFPSIKNVSCCFLSYMKIHFDDVIGGVIQTFGITFMMAINAILTSTRGLYLTGICFTLIFQCDILE